MKSTRISGTATANSVRPCDTLIDCAELLTRQDLDTILAQCIESARSAPNADPFFLNAAASMAASAAAAPTDDSAISSAIICFKECRNAISNRCPGAIESHEKERAESVKQSDFISKVASAKPGYIAHKAKRYPHYA